ncbi:MAG: enoyl-CoA hydratase/isomerase family protein [Leifsonia sp.]
MSDDAVESQDSQPDAVRVEHRDDRTIVTLDRPDVRNAIDQDVVDALHAICAELEASPRILIITGAGGHFSAGADIRQMLQRSAADARAGINAHAFLRVRALELPVIAAIDGYALGGGAELAYAADIRIGTPALRMGNPETGLGIIAAAGATWRLREIVGEARASELLLTGRTVDAAEAVAIGLISSIHEPADLLGAAHAIADRIGANDRAATIATKKAIAARPQDHPEIDLELQAVLFESPERQRRMTEFLDRRRP